MAELLIVWMLLQAPVAPPAPVEAEASRVAARLVCYCGTCSNQSIRDCTCGTAGKARAEILGRLEAGETAVEVIAFYTGRYGEQVLIAPTGTGFNLIAWVTPFIVLFAAGAVLLVILKRWSGAAAPAAPVVPGATPIDSAELARLESELRRGGD